MKTRKTPMRMCAGCGQSKPKGELMRIVRSPSGEISADLSGKMPGRGVYLCKDAQCIAKARKNKRLERSLEAAVPAALLDELEEELRGLEK